MFADTTDYIGPAIYRGGNLEMVRYAGYAFCANNPVNIVDPTGMEIRGVSKQDAKYLVEDFRAMFPGDEFENFRNLIIRSGKKQNGKSLAPISDDARKDALKDIILNEDQQALVDMVVNSINSDDEHYVEYFQIGKTLSNRALDAIEDRFKSRGLTPEIAENTPGGYATFLLALCGEATTVLTPRGSLTLIQQDGEFLTNRPATLGHEVLGHGRAALLKYTTGDEQHVIPIQVENLILRNMGVSKFRDGTRHAPKNSYIPNYNSLPIFR